MIVTSLNLVTGVASAPLTVVDTANGNAPLPNSAITWVFDTSGLTGNLVIVSLPGGGFTFQAMSPIVGASLIHAIYAASSGPINGPELTINITSAVVLGYSM